MRCLLRWIVRAVAVASLSVACAACSSLPGRQPTPTAASPDVSGASVISATGKVLPEEWVELSFGASGLVGDVLVREGDSVTAGQTLAQVRAD